MVLLRNLLAPIALVALTAEAFPVGFGERSVEVHIGDGFENVFSNAVLAVRKLGGGKKSSGGSSSSGKKPPPAPPAVPKKTSVAAPVKTSAPPPVKSSAPPPVKSSTIASAKSSSASSVQSPSSSSLKSSSASSSSASSAAKSASSSVSSSSGSSSLSSSSTSSSLSSSSSASTVSFPPAPPTTAPKKTIGNQAVIPDTVICDSAQGQNTYTSRQIVDAIQRGQQYIDANTFALGGFGTSNQAKKKAAKNPDGVRRRGFPHIFGNKEVLQFNKACPNGSRLQEFPILTNGLITQQPLDSVAKGGNPNPPGPDRVVFTSRGGRVTFCGVMTHFLVGAGDFKTCKNQ